MLRDLVMSARRILGDVKSQRWTDERMLDIVNAGLVDMNRVSGALRAETAFELLPV